MKNFTLPDGFKEVNKKEFFNCMNQKNVHPYPEKYRTEWRYTNSRSIVGYSFPGYLCADEKGKYTSKNFYTLNK